MRALFARLFRLLLAFLGLIGIPVVRVALELRPFSIPPVIAPAFRPGTAPAFPAAAAIAGHAFRLGGEYLAGKLELTGLGVGAGKFHLHLIALVQYAVKGFQPLPAYFGN